MQKIQRVSTGVKNTACSIDKVHFCAAKKNSFLVILLFFYKKRKYASTDCEIINKGIHDFIIGVVIKIVTFLLNLMNTDAPSVQPVCLNKAIKLTDQGEIEPFFFSLVARLYKECVRVQSGIDIPSVCLTHYR